MKKLTLTAAILLGLSTQAYAGIGGENNNTQCNGIGNSNSPCLNTDLSLSDEEEFIIEGETDELEDGCAFFYLNDGTMAWDDENRKWYTVEDAQVRMVTRDILRVLVNTNKELQEDRGTIDEVEVVDYEESAMHTEHPFNSPTLIISENEIKINDLDGGNVLNINIDHTLEPSDSFVAEDNTRYWMVNKVTCVQ